MATLMNTSKTPCDFCCKKNCSNSNLGAVKLCKKAIAKRICRKDLYENGPTKLGNYAWTFYNLDTGIKHPPTCNCKKVGKCKTYYKAMNRYGDNTYNTTDGWPATMASPTGDHHSGSGISTYIEIVRNIQKRAIAFKYYERNNQLYIYGGKVYHKSAKVEVYNKKCKKMELVQVPCAPGARLYIPKSGLNVKAFD